MISKKILLVVGLCLGIGFLNISKAEMIEINPRPEVAQMYVLIEESDGYADMGSAMVVTQAAGVVTAIEMKALPLFAFISGQVGLSLFQDRLVFGPAVGGGALLIDNAYPYLGVGGFVRFSPYASGMNRVFFEGRWMRYYAFQAEKVSFNSPGFAVGFESSEGYYFSLSAEYVAMERLQTLLPILSIGYRF